MAPQHLTATFGEMIDASPWSVKESCLLAIALRPGHAIGAERVLTARQQLPTFRLGELQALGQRIHSLLVGMLLAVGKVLQERIYDTIKIINGHICPLLL